MTESQQEITLLPYDLSCPALLRCGGFLRTYGIDHGPDRVPTIKYFVCSNRGSEQKCPANPMISKYGNSKCKACGDIICKVRKWHQFWYYYQTDENIN